MPGPYFPPTIWPPYTFAGLVHTFDHLVEYEFDVADSAKNNRRIAVTFSDHVFTREMDPSDDLAGYFPGSSRTPAGYFCPIRYRHSLRIRDLIAWCCAGDVWLLEGDDRYGQVPTVDHDGTAMLYAIVFSLDRATGIPVDLHMRVRSAYPCDQSAPTTFGSVKFKHLARLRAEGKRPRKIFDKHRKKPKVGTIV